MEKNSIKSGHYRRVDAYGFDDLEIGLLSLARNFLSSFETPESHSWQVAHSVAIERWGTCKGYCWRI